MSGLRELLEPYVAGGVIPGAVGLVARGDAGEVAVVGDAVLGEQAMRRDSVFRIASVTKPIVAAGVMVLVDDGVLGLDEPIARRLPELAAPMVLRTPDAELGDVVPARRGITVRDLLTSTAGWGFASDFTLPGVQRLAEVQRDGREPRLFPPADEWVARLAEVPLLHQPGEAWLYDTCSTLQGVLIARAAGMSLGDFLAERVFRPLGMRDTGFHAPVERLTAYYRRGDNGLELADPPGGQWSRPPAFELGNGGLAGTADDWLAFGRMLLAGGLGAGGERVLSQEAVELMVSDRTTPAQRAPGELFLSGQGWGFGGSVDLDVSAPGAVPGRYGWVGGTGTSAHVVPSRGTVAILFTQVGSDGPVEAEWQRAFWAYAAEA